MVDKKEDKKEKDPFSDSSEIFESIFKEASHEIQSETGKVAPKPGVKPKPKPDVKPKPEAKPKPPTKLELEPKEEPEPKKDLLQEKPRSEQKQRLQPPAFKHRQEPVRRPVTRTARPEEETAPADLVSTQPLARTRIQEQTAKEESGGKSKKPKPPKRKGRGSPLLKIILLIALLAIGVGGASVYLGILDLSDYIGWPEPAKKEAPKVVAAQPPKPVTPKPAQPSAPQAKPAEIPKPPVQPAPVAPKAAETVTPPQPPPPPSTPAGTPPRPPDAQAQAQPPAPPAVAKAETPLPPAQPPVKPEPLPAPVQSPVKSAPQAPPPPVQSRVKSELQAPPPPVQSPVKSEPQAPPSAVQPPVTSQPKTLSAPVQQPVVPKRAETSQSGVQHKEVVAAKALPQGSALTAAYPYSVYLGSVQSVEYAIKGLSSYESQGFSTYWSKVHLGAKGTWYRLFTGYFRSAQEAEAFIQQKGIKDGEVRETRYSNLIGTFGTKKEGEEKALALTRLGLSAYCIPAADGQFRLYSGAFITRDGAENNQAELSSKGIKSEIVER